MIYERLLNRGLTRKDKSVRLIEQSRGNGDMMLELVLVGALTVTSYTNIPEETDDTPNWTSIGEHVHVGGCAISQDLLKAKTVKYHDYLYIDGVGLCQVNDTMNLRITDGLDLFVTSKRQEKKYPPTTRQVWKVGKAK